MTEHDGDSRAPGDADRPESRADAASPSKVEELAREFDGRGRPYAKVTVVRREPPVSANVGDRALVTPEGEVVGWIGGAACARSVVVEAATDALADGDPRLVGLAPNPDDVDRPGVESYPMTCHSGGTLELFVEPVAPRPRLVVVGDSAVSRALVRLASDLTYRVTVVADDPAASPDADAVVDAADAEGVEAAVTDAWAVVVASMGEYDAPGLGAALRAEPEYLGLVASDERRDELAAEVAGELGVDPGAVREAVTTPAGLAIGAKTAEEIAVSVLAELVAVRREADLAPASATEAIPASVGRSEPAERADAGDAETAADPVCGMDVVVGEAAATVAHGGETYHFCGEGCAAAFATEPGKYLDAEASADD